jgi:hypothetical protein
MRGVFTLILAPVLSWIVAYVAEIALGIAFDAQEELIVAMVAQILFAMAVVTLFAVILVARGGVRALAIGAAVAGGLLLLGVATFEALTLAGEPTASLGRDIPLLIELAVPALLGLLVQWWLVRRYLARRDAGPPPLVAHTVTG